MLTTAWAALLEVALACVSAAGTGASRWSRRLAVVACGVALAVPFAIFPVERFGRFVCAMLGALIALRTVDLLRMTPLLPAGRRLWHLLALFDTRLVTRRPPRLERRALGRLLVALPLGAAAFWVGAEGATHLAGWGPWAFYGFRWAGGAVLILCIFESAVALLRVVYGALGFHLPPLHEAPHLAVTVREFWARRWNRIVARWLHQNIYQPVQARWRRRAGIAATFVFSALLHADIVFPALGLRGAVSMLTFFLVQGVAVLVEVRLHTDRWPRVWARLWTLGTILGSSPLFIMPAWHLLNLPG